MPKSRRFKWFLFVVLAFSCFFVALIVGYSFFGGQPAADVFRWQTWQHLLDLIFAE